MDSTKKQELIYFQQLKHTLRKEVESSLHIRKEFKEWSGSDIQTFQIDLEEKCKSTVSEKWVYSHFKKQSEKLPRVDVLNLLSQYCGFKNWDDFIHQNKIEEPKNQKKKGNWSIVLFIVVFLAAAGLYILKPIKSHLTVLFTDAYTQKPVSLKSLTYSFGKNETQYANRSLIFKVKNSDTLKIDGPYYKSIESWVDISEMPDTLVIKVFPDDYAMMLNYFSRTEHTDWDKRKRQLETAIHNDAIIFQSHPQHEGIEMLNKDEFIDRLILPINSLKNLEIQDIVYKDEQIYNLRFVQKDK